MAEIWESSQTCLAGTHHTDQKERRQIDKLLRALSHRDDYVRLAAVQELGALGDPRAAEPLAASLNDRTASVRRGRRAGAGRARRSRAVGPLCALLDDKHPGVRLAAVRALGALGDPRAAVPLAAALKDPTLGVRLAAVQVLGAPRRAVGGDAACRRPQEARAEDARSSRAGAERDRRPAGG